MLQVLHVGLGASQQFPRWNIPRNLPMMSQELHELQASQGFGSHFGLQHFGAHGFGSQQGFGAQQGFGSQQGFGAQQSLGNSIFGKQIFGRQHLGAQHFGSQGFGSHTGFSQHELQCILGNLMQCSMPINLCPAHGSHGAGQGFGASQHELQWCNLSLLSRP